LSRINRLCHLAIHTIEAFSRRPGVAIDSVIHERARYKAQLLNLLTRRQLDFLVQLGSCERQRVTMRLNKNAVLSGEYLFSPLVKTLRH
jgi:hypothetical protein